MQELAIASVPMQIYRQLYSPPQALRRGTVFAELYKPFMPKTANEEVDKDGADETETC